MNEKQEKAFELYYSMGSSRSYDKVAKQLGLSKTTIGKWAKEFNWQDLIGKRDKVDAEQLKEEIIKVKMLILKALGKGVQQVIRDIDTGTQSVNIKDFRSFVDEIDVFGLVNTVNEIGQNPQQQEEVQQLEVPDFQIVIKR